MSFASPQLSHGKALTNNQIIKSRVWQEKNNNKKNHMCIGGVVLSEERKGCWGKSTRAFIIFRFFFFCFFYFAFQFSLLKGNSWRKPSVKHECEMTGALRGGLPVCCSSAAQRGSFYCLRAWANERCEAHEWFNERMLRFATAIWHWCWWYFILLSWFCSLSQYLFPVLCFSYTYTPIFTHTHTHTHSHIPPFRLLSASMLLTQRTQG